jgi:ABC-2 type transport system ATP-binding protein
MDASASGDTRDDNPWPPLEAWNITKRWPRNPAPVLEGVDITLDPGDLMWIGGRNGVGKTTLLRILAGLIGPDSGEVRSFGAHPMRDRRRYQQLVGFVSAGNTGLYARLTVRGQLDCWARIAFVPRSERKDAVEAAVQDFALGDLADRRSDRLSMGQRQRLRLAMTFVAKPPVVLLDEPRTSLDGEGGAMLASAILGTVNRGGAVLWVSPTGEPVGLRFKTRLVLEDGKLKPA